MRDVAEGRLQVARIVQPAMTRLLTLSITARRPMTIAAREVARLVRSLLPKMLWNGHLPRPPSAPTTTSC